MTIHKTKMTKKHRGMSVSLYMSEAAHKKMIAQAKAAGMSASAYMCALLDKQEQEANK